ncbi:MAG: hypothetical protein ACE37J_06195 [Pikeienuella sp.]|uniref:hypothetical protein n=1 Tax=Pikeienuella sp. TaxID=2831957 RepID=UPI00391C093D
MRLPEPSRQRAEVARHRDTQRATYLGSERYALEVDYATYTMQMRRDIRRGVADAD